MEMPTLKTLLGMCAEVGFTTQSYIQDSTFYKTRQRLKFIWDIFEIISFETGNQLTTWKRTSLIREMIREAFRSFEKF